MAPDRELDQIVVRKGKLTSLRQRGIDPFPATCDRSHRIADLLADFLVDEAKTVTIVGRLRTIRLHGGSCFATLEDGSGRLQIYLKRDHVARYAEWTDLLDVGDFLQVRGTTMRTNRGEPTVLVNDVRLLAKALRPLPEKWHGLSDVEIRYRKRELDLLANPDVRLVFERRSKLIKALRDFLDTRGFLEVETPILQPIAGGTIATPFVTHHEALKHDFYLRIAPELYLKRLVVGGFERVYEIGKNFRNEGIDHRHNPEFTEAEFYVAYADYQWLMTLTQELIAAVVAAVTGTSTITYGKQTIEFQAPFQRLTFSSALENQTKLSLDASDADLQAYASRQALNLPKTTDRGKLLDEIFKTRCLPHLIQPTFITDHPLELSPLAKQHPDRPTTVQRFQLIVGGMEIINAYSELNDPEEQRRRFEATSERRTKGDREAHPFDPDFLAALETGLPPTAGWGLGVDRLAMLLTNSSSIKEVLLFPTLKPTHV